MSSTYVDNTNFFPVTAAASTGSTTPLANAFASPISTHVADPTHQPFPSQHCLFPPAAQLHYLPSLAGPSMLVCLAATDPSPSVMTSPNSVTITTTTAQGLLIPPSHATTLPPRSSPVDLPHVGPLARVVLTGSLVQILPSSARSSPLPAKPTTPSLVDGSSLAPSGSSLPPPTRTQLGFSLASGQSASPSSNTNTSFAKTSCCMDVFVGNSLLNMYFEMGILFNHENCLLKCPRGMVSHEL